MRPLQTECFFCPCDPATCSKDSVDNPATKFLAVTLRLTDCCNEDCRYCYNKVGFGRRLPDMTTEDIDALLDFLDRDFRDFSVVFSFLGGEPTLRIPLIEHALKELYRRRGRYFGMVYTNAAGHVDEMAVLLKNYRNVKVQVSLPHHSSLMYAQRMQNVRHYIKMQGARGVVFTLVAEQNDIPNLYETIRLWKSFGVRSLYINFDLRNINVSEKEKYVQAIYDFYAKANDSLIDQHFDILNLQALTATSGEIGLAKKEINTYVLDYFSDRKFYPVHHVESKPVGDLQGVDLGALDRLYASSPCKACPNKHICGDVFLAMFLHRDGSVSAYDSFCIPNLVTHVFAKGLTLKDCDLKGIPSKR